MPAKARQMLPEHGPTATGTRPPPRPAPAPTQRGSTPRGPFPPGQRPGHQGYPNGNPGARAGTEGGSTRGHATPEQAPGRRRGGRGSREPAGTPKVRGAIRPAAADPAKKRPPVGHWSFCLHAANKKRKLKLHELCETKKSPPVGHWSYCLHAAEATAQKPTPRPPPGPTSRMGSNQAPNKQTPARGQRLVELQGTYNCHSTRAPTSTHLLETGRRQAPSNTLRAQAPTMTMDLLPARCRKKTAQRPTPRPQPSPPRRMGSSQAPKYECTGKRPATG